MLRRRIYQIIELSNPNDAFSRAYDILMFVAVVLGVFPLMFKESYAAFWYFEIIACSLFIIDYLLRWITADLRSSRKGIMAFVLHPITPWAIVDLLSIVPSFNLLWRGLIALRVVRLLKLVRVFRVFRYSSNVQTLFNVLRKESKTLFSVLIIAVSYIYITALVMFNSDDNFDSFFDAVYWATTALTTVGYGDVCPNTDIGRLISMLSSLFGIAVIALPSGIITAGYLNEIKRLKKQ